MPQPITPRTPAPQKSIAQPSQRMGDCVAYRKDGTRIGDIGIGAISTVPASPNTFV